MVKASGVFEMKVAKSPINLIKRPTFDMENGFASVVGVCKFTRSVYLSSNFHFRVKKVLFCASLDLQLWKLRCKRKTVWVFAS